MLSQIKSMLINLFNYCYYKYKELYWHMCNIKNLVNDLLQLQLAIYLKPIKLGISSLSRDIML